MSKLKFIAILACVSLSCDPTIVSAQHQEEISPAQMLADFEAEADHRRNEEGGDFDKEAYKFERSILDRRSALDEKRIAIDEEFNRKRDVLGNSDAGQDQNAWKQLDQEQQNSLQALDEKYQALEQESQKYWENRQSSED